MADQPAGIDKAGPYVLYLEPWISLENDFRAVTRGEHPEHVLDREAAPTEDRLAAENLGVHGDSPKEIGFVHSTPSMNVSSTGAQLHTAQLINRNEVIGRLLARESSSRLRRRPKSRPTSATHGGANTAGRRVSCLPASWRTSRDRR